MTNVSEVKMGKPQLGETTLFGRIQDQKNWDGKTYTYLVVAGADIYSQPSAFEIQSDSPLGANDTEISVTCQITGFAKPFSYVDRNNGQHKKGHNFKVFFKAVR